MRLYLMCVSVLALAMLCGCQQKKKVPDILSGQIFIVLNSRDTIKMSLVPVSLVESNFANRTIQELRTAEAKRKILVEKLAHATNTLSSLYDDLEFTERKISGMETQVQEDQDNYNHYTKKTRQNVNDFYRERGITDWDKAEMRRNVAAINSNLIKIKKRIAETKEAIEKAEDDASNKRVEIGQAKTEVLRIAGEFDKIKTRHGFWNSLANAANAATATKTTDADGRFTFTLTNKAVSVVAYATRKTIGDDEDEYFWIVPLHTNLSQPLLLNNANKLD